MSKPCFKCGETKPLDAFYKHPMMADGHLNKCIECAKLNVRSSRAARLEYYQAYDRSRAKWPQRVADRKQRAKEHPRSGYREPDPVKQRARNAISNALRDGRLKKPVECEVCAVADDRLHGHHEDYAKALEVIWVCAACHALVHSYWRALGRAA